MSSLEVINEQMVDNINTKISKEIAIQFLPKLIRTMKIDNENSLIRINELVRLESNTIQNRITNNSKTRFMNLVNMIEESKTTSLKMLERTGEALEKLGNNGKQNQKGKKGSKKLKKTA